MFAYNRGQADRIVFDPLGSVVYDHLRSNAKNDGKGKTLIGPHSATNGREVFKPCNLLRHYNLIFLAVGVVFLYWMLKKLGWANLAMYFVHVGYRWPLLFLPYGLVNCLGMISWSNLLPDRATRPSLGRLYLLYLSGESLNQLTPTASMGGEPYKAFRLKAQGVPWEQATASVVIQKGMMVLSLVLYIFLGLALNVFVLNGSASHLGLPSLAALALGVACLLFLVVQRRGPCVSAIRLLEKCGLCPKKLKDKEQEHVPIGKPRRTFLRTCSRRKAKRADGAILQYSAARGSSGGGGRADPRRR